MVLSKLDTLLGPLRSKIVSSTYLDSSNMGSDCVWFESHYLWFATVQKNSETDYSVVEMYPSGTPGPKGATDPEIFADLAALKKKNSNLKTLVAIGGWTFNDAGTGTETYFSDIMNDPTAMQSFVTSAAKFATDNGFDGVEIDWEYPGLTTRGGKEIDFYNFEQFVKLFKKDNPDLILSMDCGPFLSSGINFPELSGYSDQGIKLPMIVDADYFNWLARLAAAGINTIQVMAYDYATALKGGGTTSPNAPLTMGSSSTKEDTSNRSAKKIIDCDRAKGKTRDTSACDASSISDAPICLVSVHGINKTVNHLLNTYNNLDSSGKPDLVSFNKNNQSTDPYKLTDTLPTSGTYKVCGVQYTVLSGDGYYQICKINLMLKIVREVRV